MTPIVGKSILITGASFGIGAALARAAAQTGARQLTLIARTRDALEQVAAEARRLGSAADVYAVDLTDAEAVAQTAKQIIGAHGPPDVVISNAGAGRWLFVEETTPDEAVAMMAMPYFAAFYLTRALLPGMITRGSGHLVYVNSPASLVAWPGATGYTAARWALRGFAEALEADLNSTGLHVSTIIPGLVSSTYFANNPGTLQRAPKIARLLGTITPEQAAHAVLRGIERNRRTVVFPASYAALHVLNSIAPGLVRWIAVRTGAKR